jgi:hypothetical protein
MKGAVLELLEGGRDEVVLSKVPRGDLESIARAMEDNSLRVRNLTLQESALGDNGACLLARALEKNNRSILTTLSQGLTCSSL